MRFAATKPELRGVMRAKLAALSPSDARAKSVAIWERLAILPEFARAQRVLVYVSKEKEVDTHGLIQQLLALGVDSPTLKKEMFKRLALKYLSDSRQEVKDRIAEEIDG